MKPKRRNLIEPKFKECPTCVHFSPGHFTSTCRACGVGENFEEHIEELDPSDEQEMMLAWRKSNDDN